MTYREAIEYLYQLRLFGTKLGLENTFRLANAVGSPQDRLRFIHVAGTNGKGSVCAYLERIYRSAGYKVGMFTSPHLVQFGERMQVQRIPIAPQDLVRHVEQLRQVIADWPKDTSPTFFEFITVLALQHFAEQSCDIVIWETGMGGRLDATNIVQPACSIITNVSMDHQAWLGDSLTDIAREKAGIIKPGRPIVTAESNREPLKIIMDVAHDQNAPVYHIESNLLPEGVSPGLKGSHQHFNASTAIQAVELLQTAFPVPAATVNEAIVNTRLPGRFQIIEWNGRQVVLDVAHNGAGIQTVVDSWKECFGTESCDLIFASLNDKPWRESMKRLAPLCHTIHLVPAQSQRSASTQAMAEYVRQITPNTQVTEHEQVESALTKIRNNKHPLLITGSFYLVGGVLPKLDPVNYSMEELSLNEWGAVLNSKL
jgi:dihydrofolate synthase / folylpolyglutamate synthase